MESIIIGAIGVAALGYLSYLIWQSISGKGTCSCGNTCNCKSAGKSGSCCTPSSK